MRGTLNDQSLLYLQIAAMVEDDILRGVYREEEQVPSTNELARGYNINPATAAKGLGLLVAEGILYKKRGIGMFVAAGGAERVREKRKRAFSDSYIRPLVREAHALGLSGQELAEMLREAMGDTEKGESV